MEVCLWVMTFCRTDTEYGCCSAYGRCASSGRFVLTTLDQSTPIADLHQIIKSGQALTNEHVQYFVYQILRGMATLNQSLILTYEATQRHEIHTLSRCGA